MKVLLHIESIDIGGKARYEKEKYSLWVVVQPSIVTQPFQVDGNSLSKLCKDYQFDNECTSVKISLVKNKLFGNETLCELDMDLTNIPLNKTFRSVVPMKALRQIEQPRIDLTLSLITDFNNPPQAGNLNLQNFIKQPEGFRRKSLPKGKSTYRSSLIVEDGPFASPRGEMRPREKIASFNGC